MIVPSQCSERSFTNQVLMENAKNSTIYYVPAYLRVKLKHINDIDLSQLTGNVNTTIILSIYYEGLNEELKKCLEEKVELQFNRNSALKLQRALQITLKDKPKQKYLTYTVRKMLDVRLYGQVFWTPFQIISLIMTIGVRSIDHQTKSGRVTIKFNLMDHHNTMLKLSYSDDTRFGQYTLAPARMIAECSTKSLSNYQRSKLEQAGIKQKYKRAKAQHQSQNHWQNLTQKQRQVASNIGLIVFEEADKLANIVLKNVQYGHFIIPLYRRPGIALVTIFFPLMILAVINLGIFFQNEKLGKRFLNISALMVSYVALIPTLREQIPPGPTLTFVQFLVYSESITTLICLMQSIEDRNDSSVDQRFTTDWFNNGFLMASIVITVLVFSTITVLYLIHKFCWEPDYLNVDQGAANQKFNMLKWKHKLADAYYQKFANRVQSLGDYQVVEQIVQT